ncbi:SDR family oxidoreductase [Brevundimonas sp. S30B]|uniref:SDR family NAD(P)-dependent oxidoreductase n=1 Tax=unclassified Brevundimonas TaxID=2622653 RepID=UPI001072E0DA|nr:MULTISPECIES: SDR family oxidoreductase [unclassified Brevundimonas]QBX36753.1 SDR family oxidoreductase [Brevundimonas sp. MF30-B]TFW04452.1 SDR family oxidoreductase [Brevundimonas sp. S30B]
MKKRTVLISGASAGIGAALARVCAADGWDLVLTARREDRLLALADEIMAAHPVQARVVAADLAQTDAVQRLVQAIEDQGLMLDGLINNAGFSRTTGFLQTDPADHAAMLRVMLSAPVELTRLLLPGMVQRGFGRVLNVASLAGLMPATGGDTLYGPIKSFLIKASQGLHLETHGTGVHVTVLNPGYTLTEFHDVNGSREQVSSAYPAWMWMDADRVARIGWNACEAGRASVTPGLANRLLSGLAKHLPDATALRMVGGHAQRLKRL